jgi:hypothetical protein
VKGEEAEEHWVEARLLAHWAAQLVAAASATLGPAAPDDSHTSLEWIEPARALAGIPLGSRGVRAALRPADLTLLVLDAAHSTLETLHLGGRTLQSGLEWLSGVTARATGNAVVPLTRPMHELPDHAVGAGAPFADGDPAALAQLASCFSIADRLLRGLAVSLPNASPVRCWPHHFDIATLATLDSSSTPSERARTIGVGLSPGDASYRGPYWYVTPWPSPPVDAPPQLAANGAWHRAGWFGAVLSVAHLDAGDEARSLAFLESAIAACRQLLGAGSFTS